MTSPTPLNRLQHEIAQGQALAILGAGISIGATRNARASSWTGLLEDGVERCLELGWSAEWADRVRAEIQSGDMDDLLSAAEKVSRKLKAPDGGNFRTWLRESVGALRVEDPAVLEALRDLNIPLATTNYDGLLEEVTGLPPVTWRDGSQVERLLRGDHRGILHFHGHWNDPESVVLGIRSYEKVRQDPHAQAVLHALRSLRTLIFIGCGEGLSDPNFGTFLTWVRQVFGIETEYKHYRLCRDSEIATLRSQHPADEPVALVGYGKNHSDLAPLLRSLRTTQSHRESSPEFDRSAPRLPPMPRFFGRDAEVETLVAALCADRPLSVPVLGPAGAGKTTVTLAALHDRRVADRFGVRRWFIRCDGTTSRDPLIGEIATGIGLVPGSQFQERSFRELERAPGVLVLDNAETPWEADMEKVEDLLAQLDGLPGIVLVASFRGDERPLGPAWNEAIRIGPLPLSAAREAFLTVAGERFRADPDLDRLLQAVDCLSLAVTLLACQAQAEPDLASLWSRWQQKRTTLLRRGDAGGRLMSLEVSLEISINGPRMTEDARRLLSLLGLLPDGIAHQDLNVLIPEAGDAAAATLRRVGLAFSQDSRLRVLAPTRAHSELRHPPSAEDLERTRQQYLELAAAGHAVGRNRGAEVVQRLGPETGNLEAMILRALAGPKPIETMDAVRGIAELFRFTGLGAPTLVDRVLVWAREHRDQAQEARCLEWLGHLALSRTDQDTACAHYETALALFRRVGDVRGEADCMWRLGDIALERADFDAARGRYEEALPIFKRIGDGRGEANCIKGLGNLALEQSDYNTARTFYEEALPLYRRNDHGLGEANCIVGLSDIASRHSDFATARALIEEALPIYRRVGDVLGEANCLQGLGDLALRQVSPESARSLFLEALALYSRIQNSLSLGWIHVRLARIEASPKEHQRHIDAARQAWIDIKRNDLIQKLGWEFDNWDRWRRSERCSGSSPAQKADYDL